MNFRQQNEFDRIVESGDMQKMFDFACALGAVDGEDKTFDKYGVVFDWLLSDDTGLSSEHLADHMLGSPVRHFFAPSDADDRGRCIRLLKLMPEWKERLYEMEKYPGWSEQISLILTEFSQ